MNKVLQRNTICIANEGIHATTHLMQQINDQKQMRLFMWHVALTDFVGIS